MQASFRRMFMALLLIALTAFAVFLTPVAAQSECTNPPPRLVVGEPGRVLPRDPNNVRDQPSRSGALIGAIPGGGQFTVVDGPVCADDLNWWHVESADLTGWTVEGADGTYWIEPLPEDAPPAAPEPSLIRGECPYTTNRVVFSTIRTEVRADGETLYGQLITTDVDGGNACLLTEMSGEPAYTDDLLSQPVWSPDGSQIVFRMAASWDDTHILYLINADGTALRPLTSFDDSFTDMSWSPDGERIAFMSDSEIWVGFADGRGSRRVVEDRGQFTALSWSPDGEWLAYANYGRKDSGAEIHVVSPDGGQPVLIAETGVELSPISHLEWSPDSAMLEVSAPQRGIHRIIVPAVLDSEPRQLVAVAGDQRMSPNYSPDGTQLTYWSGEDVRDSAKPITLGIMSADGATETPLIEEVVDPLPRGFSGIYPPSWSPNGSQLVFGTLEGVYTVGVETGEVTQIWAGEIGGAPQFQPGG
ncbi:MAG: PD40 domain-containing protein [Chloroflexi bacterium]|nr:PD40 domain-containing protein [Chloroflexota bacterium]